MDEETRIEMWEKAFDAVGILPAAHADARVRARAHFQDQEFYAFEARQFAEGLRQTAPHFFPRTAMADAREAGDTPKRPRRPQPLALDPAQVQALAKLPPAARLTKYRELQQEKAASRAREEERITHFLRYCVVTSSHEGCSARARKRGCLS